MPIRLRRATLHISNYQKCFEDPDFRNLELCATSTVTEGKACKASTHINYCYDLIFYTRIA